MTLISFTIFLGGLIIGISIGYYAKDYELRREVETVDKRQK